MGSKQLIRSIIALEQELQLPEDELRLIPEDHVFLVTESPSRQRNWSIDTLDIAFPTAENSIGKGSHEVREGGEAQTPQADDTATLPELQQRWLQEYLVPQRDLDSYHVKVMEGVIQALVQLQVAAAPENPAQWFICFLQGESVGSTGASSSTTTLLFKTNYELMRKIDQLKHEQREMHDRWERLQACNAQLRGEVILRNAFIARLSESHLTTRTQAIMDGTPVFLNAQKHWVLPGFLLLPTELCDAEAVGLQRAEAFLMQKDELRWRFLLDTQRRYDASVLMQTTWRGSRAHRKYEALKKQRKQAAVVIQRNYFHYLFHRAISLPEWCVAGREVVVAPSIAQKCAISFQFYPKKDFPTGNYKRLDAGKVAIPEMMELCRLDEECAGFSTDGAMKRFLPRKLSQLKDMAELHPDGHSSSLTMKDGLYVKIHPSKAEKLVNTGVIVSIPEDRFGFVQVVLDGIAISENVPLAKLSDRWKRIRIKLLKKRSEKKVKRTFVFGKMKEEEEEQGNENEVDGGHVHDSDGNSSAQRAFEKLGDDDEEREELRRRWKRVLAGDASSRNAHSALRDDTEQDELVEYLYEDQATKRVLRKEPKHTYEDPEVRARVIATRKQQYEAEQTRKYETKKLESIVRLQCAWRSKRAREAFRQVIQLRAKERERENLVNQVHLTHESKHQHMHKASKSKKNFFSKWFR